VTAVADRLSIPKNSAFRILCTLHQRGYVERDEAGKLYCLSRKLLALGYAAVDERNLIERSVDVLRDLRDQTDETVLIAVRAGTEGVVLDQVLGHHAVKIAVEIGYRFPLHTGAPGKALVAALPDAEQKQVINQLTYTRFNERTITSKVRIRREMARVREQGYATDEAEEIEGVNCVGAAVRNHHGYPVAGIWVTGPAYRLAAEQFPAIGEKVLAGGEHISERFGHRVLRLAQSS